MKYKLMFIAAFGLSIFVHQGVAQTNRQVEINLQNSNGETPLMLAAKLGRDDLVKLLIDLGADCSIKDNEENTLLMSALEYGQESTAKILLAKFPNMNEKNLTGTTPLMLAAENGMTDIARQFIKSGAAVNAKDKGGRTALFYAAGAGRTEMETLLLKSGANGNLKDNDGNNLAYYRNLVRSRAAQSDNLLPRRSWNESWENVNKEKLEAQERQRRNQEWGTNKTIRVSP